MRLMENMPDIKLRHASLEDAFEIARIHIAAWRQAYRGLISDDHLDSLSVTQREAFWRAAIQRGDTTLILATIQGQIAGWVSIGACRDPGATAQDGEIWAIYIDPAHWGRGIGQALWRAARQQLLQLGYRTASLWVLCENAQAIRFYLAAGFKPDPESIIQVAIGGANHAEIRYTALLAPDSACRQEA